MESTSKNEEELLSMGRNSEIMPSDTAENPEALKKDTPQQEIPEKETPNQEPSESDDKLTKSEKDILKTKEEAPKSDQDSAPLTGQALLKEILSWILTCAAAVAIAFLLKEYVIITANVPTSSMENTIMTGDNLIGFRLAYNRTDPKRGDIAIFYNPDDESEKYIKRVIGLPGDTVEIEDSVVYINGVALEEDYLKEKWIYYNDGYTFEVPENCYFMMGDNRNNSKDARLWDNTYVSKDKIIGKALWIYWPLNHWGSLCDNPGYVMDSETN